VFRSFAASAQILTLKQGSPGAACNRQAQLPASELSDTVRVLVGLSPMELLRADDGPDVSPTSYYPHIRGNLEKLKLTLGERQSLPEEMHKYINDDGFVDAERLKVPVDGGVLCPYAGGEIFISYAKAALHLLPWDLGCSSGIAETSWPVESGNSQSRDVSGSMKRARDGMSVLIPSRPYTLKLASETRLRGRKAASEACRRHRQAVRTVRGCSPVAPRRRSQGLSPAC